MARRQPPFFRTKKLAIVGNTGSKVHTPWFDPSWTIACHPVLKGHCLTEPDWWFDLHGPQNFRKGKDWMPNYYQWLKHLTVPIFMQKDWPDVPMAVAYPFPRILAEYRPYFTNQVAWMIALAMSEGVTHIGLFGCEYKHELERGKQRGSCEYWMGRFEGAGGHLVLPPGCSLLADPKELYGLESHDEQGCLIPSYKTPKKTAAPEPNTPPELIPVGAANCPPLATLPEGEPVAVDRAALLTGGT